MHASDTIIPLKCDAKDMHTHVTKATKYEREILPVEQLTKSPRFTPPELNDEIKRISNLKIKPHYFDNLQRCMGGMGHENL